MQAFQFFNTLSQSTLAFVRLILCVISLWAIGQRETHAQSTDSVGSVQVGVTGHCRVGRWTAIKLNQSRPIDSIETRDGDGVRIVYRQPGDATWGYAIPGSEAAPLIVRDHEGQVVATRFPTIGSPDRQASMIPREMRWIVALGDPLGIDTIGANELLGRAASIAVSKPTQAMSLPDSSLGYDGVDMLVISGSSTPLLAALSDQQHQAIEDWITSGGYVLLTLGESAPALIEAAPWLLDLLPIDKVDTVTIRPSALETYTSTQTPLETFVGVKLPRDRGQVVVMGRSVRRISTPIAVEYDVGFGQIVAVAGDLETELFATWPQRLDLLTQLTGSLLIPETNDSNSRSRATAYDDLAGQLRTTLDQFTSRRGFAFSVVSLVLLGLLAAIGPLDYLVINRLLGRPLLGWITFPLVIIAFSSVLVWQSRSPSMNTGDQKQALAGASETAVLETNQIEVFDLDTIDQVGRGFAARYFYTHEARNLDVDVIPSDAAVRITDAGSNDATRLFTAPLGTPGPAYGGFPIAIEDSRMPTYMVDFQAAEPIQSSIIRGLPISSRSSKGVFSRGRFQPRLDRTVTLRQRPGSQLLSGEFVNPLPIDLLDGVLVYGNWSYRLPTRFPAGGSVRSVAKLRQKNFRWQLTRQQALEESATRTEAWNPGNIESLDRIAEMVMFHQAAGGTRYTTLRNEPLSHLDLSHLLSEDRCVVVGRLAEPLTHCQFSDHDQIVPQRIGKSLTLVRIVLPVQR